MVRAHMGFGDLGSVGPTQAAPLLPSHLLLKQCLFSCLVPASAWSWVCRLRWTWHQA